SFQKERRDWAQLRALGCVGLRVPCIAPELSCGAFDTPLRSLISHTNESLVGGGRHKRRRGRSSAPASAFAAKLVGIEGSAFGIEAEFQHGEGGTTQPIIQP